MSEWLDRLPENRRRGSFPRCLKLMHGERESVAAKLTDLVGIQDVQVQASDFWMPGGLPALAADGTWDSSPINEAKICETERFLPGELCSEIANWWLAVPARANTPNWDIASTCLVGGNRGLLLIEAKAHEAELKSDGKRLDERASDNSRSNDRQIRRAVGEASTELSKAMPGWCLSCDSHYQLANRFAWAWKIASLGVPVVLVYLGFLGATEMRDKGEPFIDCADWTRVVLEHSRGIVPARAWGRELRTRGAVLRPLVRVCNEAFE